MIIISLSLSTNIDTIPQPQEEPPHIHILTHGRNVTFVKITDTEIYTLDWLEQNIVKVTNDSTKRSHLFRLDVDVYKINNECYFKKDIVDILNLKGEELP
jgi:hypothetical protein